MNVLGRMSMLKALAFGISSIVVSLSGTDASAATGKWRDAGCCSNCSLYYSSPEAACKSLYDRCAPTDSVYLGAKPGLSWDSYACHWLNLSGGPLGGPVFFVCDSEYKPTAFYNCVKNESARERPKCESPDSGSVNPTTPHPISLLTGSKLLEATDFETADGLFRVRRLYRSMPSTNSLVGVRDPAGLSPGWRFEFMPELHLASTDSTTVSDATWHASDGSSYDFRPKGTSGEMEPAVEADGIKFTGYQLFRTSAPNSQTGATTWELTEPDGTIWELGTYNVTYANPEQHFIARPISRTTRDGYTWNYTYGDIAIGKEANDVVWPGHGGLESISDSFGRTLTFNWIRRNPNYIQPRPSPSWPPGVRFLVTPEAIAWITLPDGTSLHYTYDSKLVHNFDGNVYHEYLGPGDFEDTHLPPDRLRTVTRINSDDLDFRDEELDRTEYLYEKEGDGYENLVTRVKDSRGINLWHFDYDSDGRAILSERIGGAEKYTVEYQVGADIHARRVTGPLGRKMTYLFDSTGGDTTRLKEIQGTPGAAAGVATCGADIRAIKYAGGFISETRHATVANLPDQPDRVTKYTRNSQGWLIQKGITAGEDSGFTYTAKRDREFPSRILRARNGLNQFFPTYDADGRIERLEIKGGKTKRTDAGYTNLRRNWSMTYDTGGLVDTVDGPLEGTRDKIDFDYDGNGYLSDVYWLDETETITHSIHLDNNDRGQPTSFVDLNDLQTTLTYDDSARKITVLRNPGGGEFEAETVYSYTAAGDLARIDLPNDAAVEYQYDDARRLTRITTGTGTPISGSQTIDLVPNEHGQPKSVTVKSTTGVQEAKLLLGYDELARVNSVTSTVDGHQRVFTYDLNGKFDKVIEPSVTETTSAIRTYDYDFNAIGQIKALKEPGTEGATTSVGYGSGLLSSVVDGLAHTTVYSRNSFDEVLKVKSPDSGMAQLARNEQGRITRALDARGVLTEYTRDGLGRVLAKTFPNSGSTDQDVDYDYDAYSDTEEDPNYGRGRLTGVTDESGHTAYKYDKLGRPYVVERTFGAAGRYKTTYSYDKMGQIKTIKYPSGRIVQYTLNTQGEVNAVLMTDASGTSTVASSISYQPFHPRERFEKLAGIPMLESPHLSGLKGLTYGNGLALTLDYNDDGRLSSMLVQEGALTPVQDLVLAYYPSGDLKSLEDRVPTSAQSPTKRSQEFEYDVSGRLFRAYGPAEDFAYYGKLKYLYDAVGNRSSREVLKPSSSRTETYERDAESNRVTRVTGIGTGNGAGDIAYDDNGSIVSDGRPGRGYLATYNNSGRLESVKIGTDNVRTYLYDALGHRVQEEFESGATHTARAFVYDLAGHLIAEYSEDVETRQGTLKQEYIWLGNTPIAMVRPGGDLFETFYIHTDHLGSPQILTNENGRVRWQGYFDPFGVEHSIETPEAQNPVVDLRFPGQEWDAVTKLSQNWHRDYDPTLGRYIESDPIGLAGGVNTYTYTHSSPTNLTDPRGLDDWYVQIGGEYASIYGGTYAVGVVLDTDSIFDSGLFVSSGPGVGSTGGFGLSVGYNSCDIEGLGIVGDLNLGPAGGGATGDADGNFTGGYFGVPGLNWGSGGGTFLTNTRTITIPGLLRGM